MYLTTRLRFTEPQNAPQATQERGLDRLADDTAATDGRNTEPLDAVGGARGMMETKVGSPGACRRVPDQPKLSKNERSD